MRKNRIILLLIFILVIGIGFYYYQKSHNDKENHELQGNVDIRQVDLGFRVGGRIEAMLVDEGDKVSKGTLLAKLDQVPYLHEKSNQQGLYDQALANYAKNQKGSRPQEILEAFSVVRERQAAYTNATRNLKRQSDLVKRKLTSQQAYDDAQTLVDESLAQLKTSQESLKLVEEGFRKEDISFAKAQWESAQARLSAANTALEDTNLLAPNDGTILTRVREPGGVVNIGETVYVLSLDKPVWVRAYINEKQLGLIKPGMKVQIKSDTPSNPLLEGEVGFISPQAEFTPKNVQTLDLRTQLVYRIRITVDDKDGILRQGMPVTILLNLDNQNKQNIKHD